MKAQYDLQRAKLEVLKGDTIPRIQLEQAKLAIGDAEQKLKELEAKIKSDKAGAEASVAGKQRKRDRRRSPISSARSAGCRTSS